MIPGIGEITNLTEDSKSRIDFWVKYLELVNARSVAEVGVWKGDFASEILRRCDFIEHYYLIDPWKNLSNWNKPFNVEQEIFDDVYREAIRKTEFAASKITVLRGCTKEVIGNIPDGSLDFAYVDGDHTLRGITIDLVKLLPKIKCNGTIGGDDFVNSPWQHKPDYEPTLVCPFAIYFCEAFDIPITALPHSQFLIQNSDKDGFAFNDLTGDYEDISLGRHANARINRKLANRIKKLFR